MLTDAQRAVLVSRLRRGRTEPADAVPRRPAGAGDPPCSSGQEQLWFIDRFAPGIGVYNIPLALRLSGQLDAAALGRALADLAARHEALRTRLVPGPDGRPVQRIDPPGPVPLPLADLSHQRAPRGWRERLDAFIDDRALQPFTLSKDRLLRAWLTRIGDAAHVLVLVIHHAVFDGWSAKILVAELAALYRAQTTGCPAGLPDLPIQFGDYAAWERHRLAGPELARLEDYWWDKLRGLGTVEFPADRQRPPLDDFTGGLVQHLTRHGLLDRLRELSRASGTTLFMTLLAGLNALLYRYTGQSDLTIGTVTANRARPELIPLIGFLVNTLPIRADLSGDPAFTELLSRTRAAVTGAFAHQDLPFARLVEALGIERDASRAPVFQIALVYAERDHVPVPSAGVEFALTDLVVGTRAAKFDLSLLAEPRPDGLWLECSYKTALFDEPTIRRLITHLENLLDGAAANPAAAISRLPLLEPDELRAELTGWNDAGTRQRGQALAPGGCVHEAFAAQAARTPDAIAAEYGTERFSYAELDAWADKLAGRLHELCWPGGTSPRRTGQELLVGVCMNTGLRRLATLLAIWKAGAGYVPLDPALPAGRLAHMIAETAMAAIVTDGAARASLPDVTMPVETLDDSGWAAIGGLDRPRLARPADPATVAYVMYTSGSTGRPKGVVVEHRQVTSFLHAMITHWQVGPTDAVLQYASLGFDVSVLDMFVPLLAGGRLVLAPTQTLRSPRRLAALITDRRVTLACLTPAVLGLLADQDVTGLRILLAAGEELPSELALRWLRPGLRFVNAYGPTETTVLATWAELDAGTPLPPPIGLPLRPHCRAYILDRHLNPVPVGAVGELHIGGPQVARGYLRRPALTATRFVADPFADGQRLYKTGDLARRRPDGSIVYVGRADTQVKVRGLRIELGEIEATLAAHPAVSQAVATIVATPGGDKQLAVYYLGAAAAKPQVADLRAHLARSLPAYMVPAHLIMVEEFPLNPSGKIDRKALPAPEPVHSGGHQDGPATPTAELLAGLYAAILHGEQPGPADSFFDLGGSSLTAMQLADQIAATTGADIGVAAIFLHPTPRQLAARVDAALTQAPGSAQGTPSPAGASTGGPLVPLSTATSEPPLVLIHPIGGTVFGYAALAVELAGTFTSYGLQSPALAGGANAPDGGQPDGPATLPGLVARYTSLIRAAWPTGPYRLAGWSMGGLVAFEIAAELERSGADVALLALLDAPFDIGELQAADEQAVTADFVADAARSLGWDTGSLPDPAAAGADQLGWLADRLSTPASPAAALAGQFARRLEVFGAHRAMLSGYRPARPPVRAPALLVSADLSLNAPARDRWPGLLAGLRHTLRLPADHYTLLQPPHLADIATAMIKLSAET